MLHLLTTDVTGHCTHRERVHVAAMTAWAEGRVREAAALWEGWLLEQPVDALTVRLLHDTYYLLGDREQLRDSPGRVMGAWEASHPGYLRMCGMFAFGAQECGQYALAEEQGIRVLSEDMRDVWALHAVLHVHQAMSRRNEAQRLLREARFFWDDADRLFTHLHWHWGVLQLEDGQFEKALMRYDMWIRETHSPAMADVRDAASMLWRMELYGNPVYDRWDELVPYVRIAMGKHTACCNDVHIAMVLVAAGEDEVLDQHLESLYEYAYASPFYAPALSSSVSTPADHELVLEDPSWGFSTTGKAEAMSSALQAAMPSPTVRAGDPVPTRDSGLVQVDPVGWDSIDPSAPELPPVEDDEEGRRITSGSLPPGYGSGGYTPRPVLAAPFSVLPVLPLQTAAREEGPSRLALPGNAVDQEDVESTDIAGEMVSTGGVGGIGLGSHSLVDNRYITAAVGIPLIEGMVAYRVGDYEEAVRKLMPVRQLLQHVGGSADQQDIFRLTLEAAATQSRQLLLARALLRERATRRPNDGMSQFHLSSILYGTGERKQASQARDRALRQGLGEERAYVRTLFPTGRMQRSDDRWGR